MNNKIIKNTVILMMVTMLGKMLGFAREIILASIYGATNYSDAYLVALNIPTIMTSIIGSALATTFIPMYFDIQNSKGSKLSLKFSNNVFNIAILISFVMCILGIVFAKEVVKVFAFGFKDETYKLTVNFTRIMMIGVIFIVCSSVMTCFLQVKNNFTIPGIINIPYNIIIILAMIISTKKGIYVMIWGTLIGIISQFIIQLPFAYKKGYIYSPYINLKDDNVYKMIKLVFPVLIGTAAYQINSIVDKTLASTLTNGSISALNYANRLNGFVIGLFITTIVSVLYPEFSKISSKNKSDEFKKLIIKSINIIIILIVPISIGAIVFAKPIVSLLFERGAFGVEATKMTSTALVYYSIGMVGAGLYTLLGKIFYALKDTQTPMKNGVICVVLNIILNFLLVNKMGYAGLAFGTSIANIISVVLLLRSLYIKIGDFGGIEILKTGIKCFVSAMTMSFIVLKIYSGLLNFQTISNLISLIISIFFGVIIYFILIYFLKIDEAKLILQKISFARFRNRYEDLPRL